MRKLLIIFFIFIPNNSHSNENIVKFLKEGKKIVFIRHALAPGNGDPNNFDIKDCSTQRNLNDEGRAQSKRIRNFFEKNNIKIDRVLSSEWCRCKDTAKIAFGKFETFSALNSFYETRFSKNKSKQMKDLREYISKWESDSNLIIVTHYVVILDILDRGTSSGEMIISDKNLNIISNFEIN
tara:strand:- start:510 stop:1052 length:543 start_codon:yes stop_codon:yes gene_type:complete